MRTLLPPITCRTLLLVRLSVLKRAATMNPRGEGVGLSSGGGEYYFHHTLQYPQGHRRLAQCD